MRRFLLIMCLWMLCCVNSNAQLISSLKDQFKQKPKFSLRFDTRNSFIANKAAKIRGIKFGLDYGKDVTVGMSFNWLDKKFSTTKNVMQGEDTVVAHLDFGYLGAYFEYTFYRTEHWEISIPVQIGIGSTFFGFRDEKNKQQRLYQKPIIVYEPSMTADYKFWRYLGVGAGVGYRLMLVNNKDIEGNFNSPIYVLKLKVYLGDMYRDVFKK
jgi:hypothetical protein